MRIALVALMVVLVTGWAIPPGTVSAAALTAAAALQAQGPPDAVAQPAGQLPPPAALLVQVFQLITEEALAPPPYTVLLQAAVEGMRAALRAAGVATPLADIPITGYPDQDLQAVLARLQRATALLSGGPAGSAGSMEVAYAAVKAMVAAVREANSVFLTPDEQARFSRSESGEFVGIGVVLEERDGRVVIARVLEDSPAAQAGVLPEDVIEAVNGQPTAGLGLEQVRALIAGEEGGVVTLQLLRPATGTQVVVSITRARIRQRTLTARLVAPAVGYVRLTQFRRGVAQELGQALTALRAEGARGIVLDLRDNPGGLLNESVDVASYFLDEGVVITVQERTTSRTYTVRPRQPKFTRAVAVLVNRGSASASEVVAGALQDAGIRLVGETTFGKSTIQLVYEFPDGSALRLTVARYLTRNGRDISGRGLVPDLVVPLGMAVAGTPSDAQLQRAVMLVSDLVRGVAHSRRSPPAALAWASGF